MAYATDSAVLFIVFNRPETTAQVFEAIRQAKPPRLYVAADGPRKGEIREEELIAKVREIATRIDWPCELNTLYHEKNLGAQYGPKMAIDWFFENEEQGIILEDDCLPSSSFFGFCDILLIKYKENKNIKTISGYNHFPVHGSSSYYFCKQPGIWGWASWKDRWEEYVSNPIISNSSLLDLPSSLMQDYWRSIFVGFVEDRTYWDYQLTCLIMRSRGFSIRPLENLVQNIGHGVGATHTKLKNAKVSNNFARDIDLEVLDSIDLEASVDEDLLHYMNRFDGGVWAMIRRKLHAFFS